MLKRTILLLGISAGGAFSSGLDLPSVFSDHMVLQRNQPVPVWGTADPGTTVTVEVSPSAGSGQAGQKKTAVADSSNHWKIILDPMPASSKPWKMTVSGNLKSEVINRQFADVLIGEVWLCSGQSNMGWVMSRSENGNAAIAAADHPGIRLYKTPIVSSTGTVERISSAWEVCTPASIAEFSAVAYYFGKKLHEDLDVPVGLLLSSLGGSKIEAWIPSRGFESVEALSSLREESRSLKPEAADPNNGKKLPSALYNGMIHAHIPYAIRGAIWYQGEANHRDGMLYVEKTRALLNSWRKSWGSDFPFYFVQITPYHNQKEDPLILPEFWEAQAKIVKVIPNTGMAVVSDAATPDNIHPPNKVAPGTRLALLAEAKTYGMDVVSTGPVSQTLEVLGNHLRITFDSAEGLTTRDGNPPDWFEIAGADGVFKPAQAEISGQSIIISSPEVPLPQAMRFAWHKLAMPNLMNGAGLPASAFRAGKTP